jgi:hypothetical protein
MQIIHNPTYSCSSGRVTRPDVKTSPPYHLTSAFLSYILHPAPSIQPPILPTHLHATKPLPFPSVPPRAPPPHHTHQNDPPPRTHNPHQPRLLFLPASNPHPNLGRPAAQDPARRGIRPRNRQLHRAVGRGGRRGARCALQGGPRRKGEGEGDCEDLRDELGACFLSLFLALGLLVWAGMGRLVEWLGGMEERANNATG